MGTDKRERQKANRQAKLAAEQAAEAKRRRARLIRNAVLLAVAIIVVGFLLSLTACGSESSAEDTAGGVSYGTAACPPEKGIDEPVVSFDDAPKRCIDPDKTYTATFTTSEGTATVELDTENTPLTTNNFMVLARWGFYDGTEIFRAEADSGILQGGSPTTQDGADPGPGYTIPDEALPFSADDYGPGTLAMARTSQPDSAGAQFFFLATDGGRYLGDPTKVGPGAGSYVKFGTVTDGLDVLQKIAALDRGTRTPSKTVTIERVTVTES